MLHFSYGANMHRAVMRRHAPGAVALGVATLANHRFIITAQGYASVEPMPAHQVYGVLWRITPRDRAMLDIWENIAAGLYRAARLPVRHAGHAQPALTYLARQGRIGRPKSGYMELIMAAAREWNFPAPYITALQQWLPSENGAPARKLGELQWT